MKKFLKRILGKEKSVSSILNSNLDINQRLRDALQFYLDEVEAERGCILLEVPGASPTMIHAGPAEMEKRFPFSRTVVDAVLDEQRGIYSFDSTQFSAARESESLEAAGSRSFVCTPIDNGSEHLGIIYLDNPTTSGLFSKENLEDLEDLAAQIASAVTGQS